MEFAFRNYRQPESGWDHFNFSAFRTLLRLHGLSQIEPHLLSASTNKRSGNAITLPRGTAFSFLSEARDWVADNIFADTSGLQMKSTVAALRAGSDSSTGWRGLHIDIWGPPLDIQLATYFRVRCL